MLALKLLLFILLWCGLMALPLKVGLLSDLEVALARRWPNFLRRSSPLWLWVLPPKVRETVRQDIDIRAVMEDIFANEVTPPTYYEDLRVHVAARLTLLSRKLMMLGMGGFVTDVRLTLDAIRTAIGDRNLPEARQDLLALSGRIAAHDYGSPLRQQEHVYFPYQRLGTSILQSAQRLDCGIGPELPAELMRVWALGEADERFSPAVIELCDGWKERHDERARAILQFVERQFRLNPSGA
jgi:hypothetical protein